MYRAIYYLYDNSQIEWLATMCFSAKNSKRANAYAYNQIEKIADAHEVTSFDVLYEVEKIAY